MGLGGAAILAAAAGYAAINSGQGPKHPEASLPAAITGPASLHPNPTPRESIAVTPAPSVAEASPRPSASPTETATPKPTETPAPLVKAVKGIENYPVPAKKPTIAKLRSDAAGLYVENLRADGIFPQSYSTNQLNFCESGTPSAANQPTQIEADRIAFCTGLITEYYGIYRITKDPKALALAREVYCYASTIIASLDK